MPLSPVERSLRSKIAVHTLHATHDPVALTERARAAFLASFEKTVDPEGVLSIEERKRRAAHARCAYMARLSMLAVRARSKDKATGTEPL